MTSNAVNQFLNNPVITSDKNATIKLAKALLTQSRQRKKNAQTVLEGVHLIESALEQEYVPVQIIISYTALTHPELQPLLNSLSSYGIANRLMVVSDALYQNIRTLGQGIDIMAIIDFPTPAFKDLYSKINWDCLILNGVQDNGNMGTLLRTAAAIGIETVLCTTGTAQAWSPKTMRAGMGAQLGLDIYEGLTVADILGTVKVPLLATSSHTDNIIYQQDLTRPVAWVVGHEGQGVCDELMQSATPIALPQPNGQESLNVAIAGALCMYETLRQRDYT